MQDTDDIKTVGTVYARAEKVVCPHCDADVEGWHGDPRGSSTVQECDDCKGKFRVDSDAEVRLV